MTIRRIITFPAPSLLEPTLPVPFPLTEGLLEHIGDLRETLAATDDGLAIASNQVLPRGHRLFVTAERTYLNPSWRPAPAVNGKPDLATEREGCLSFPGMFFPVTRYVSVQVSWQDESGAAFSDVWSSTAARMVQHECDHLDGKLFTRFLTVAQRARIRAEMIRRKQRGG